MTVNPAYIEQNDVFVLEDQGFTVGFYSLAYLANDTRVSAVTIEKDYWLDHMFVLPEYIGRGVDSKLSEHLLQRCRTKKIKEVKILADPNSRGFYEKMGWVYREEHPSSIENRATPLLVCRL